MTHMYETFNMILGENAAGKSQAITNSDWDYKSCGYNNNGSVHQLISQMQELLIATGVRYT